jgi:hypothetical protein
MGKQFKANLAKDKLLNDAVIEMPFDPKARIAEILELL